MPGRARGNPNRYRYWSARSTRRNAAAKRIGAAWRQRNRKRKGGLVSRTTQANRRAIKSLKRSIETNMIEDVNANAGNRYSGQWLESTQVDNLGEDTTGLPLVMRPFHGVSEGDGSNERHGDKIKMTSLTYRAEFTATGGIVPDTFNRCGMLVVRDLQPGATAVAPNLQGASGTGAVNQGTLLTGESNLGHLLFQNLDTNGEHGRYKILKHHKCVVQPVSATSVRSPSAVINNTLTLPYTLRYDGTAPINQQILFFFYSDSGSVPHPSVQVYCRFRYKDA